MPSPTQQPELTSSKTARLLALLILVPLTLVAVLFTYGILNRQNLDQEAKAIAASLDTILQRTDTSRDLTIAIMPLANETGNPDLDYLAFGLSADIRNQLIDVRGLTLIAEESVLNIDSQPLSTDSAALLLGASHLLTGTIKGSTDQLVIEFQFHAADQHGANEVSGSWLTNWQGNSKQLRAASLSATSKIVETIMPVVYASEFNKDSVQSAHSPDAFELYLRGKYLIDRYNKQDVLTGIQLLDQAIAIAPDFATAHAARIGAHQRMTWIDANVAEAHHELVDQAIQTWLALELEDPLTYRLRAYLASNDNRQAEALAAFQLAQKLAPNEYTYDTGYKSDLCSAGYLNDCLEQALGLARRNPVSASAHAGLANVYLLRGENEKAIVHAKLSTRFGGDLGAFFLAQSALDAGNWSTARTQLVEALEAVGVSGDWVTPYIDALESPTEQNKEKALAAMAAVDDSSAEWLDLFYAEYVTLDELDKAFDTANTLIEERYQTWALYLWNDEMKGFRSDPRFIALMQKAAMDDIWRILGPPDMCKLENPEPFCSIVQWR